MENVEKMHAVMGWCDEGKIVVYIQYLNLLIALHRLLIAVTIYISTQSKLPVHYLSKKVAAMWVCWRVKVYDK